MQATIVRTLFMRCSAEVMIVVYFFSHMTYSLWGGHKAPVHKGICVIRVSPRIHGAISRHHTDIAIVGFIEPTSFDDCDGDIGILGQSCGDSQASCSPSNNYVVVGRVDAGHAKGCAWIIGNVGSRSCK